MTEKTYDLKTELKLLTDDQSHNEALLFNLARRVIDESESTSELFDQLKEVARVFPDTTPLHSTKYLHLKGNGDVRVAAGSLHLDLIRVRQPAYTPQIDNDELGVQISHSGCLIDSESKQVFLNADILVLKLEDVKNILTLV